MAVRRFGPVLGAGVQISEEEPQQEIVNAPYGVTVLVGEFEKGPVGEPQFLSGRKDFDRRNGGRIESGDAPQAAQDFFKLGRGAGELITYRVTGGDEQKASLELYTRQGVAAGVHSGRKYLGKLEAKSGGRHGGARSVYVDDHTGAGDLTATTLDTGDTMVENEWKGGVLDLKKVTGKTYRITGNTAAGVISVEGDQDLLTDWNAGSGTPANRYVLTRDNLDYLGNEQSLAAEIVDGEENPSTEFGIVLYEDGVEVNRWKNLSADPAAKNYWVTVINKDASNYEVVATDSYVGDKTVAAVRPANFHGLSKALAATLLTLPDPDYTLTSPGSADPTVTFGALGANVRSQTLTGTVSNSGADITWTSSLGPVQVLQTSFDGVAVDLGPEALTITVTNGATALADGDVFVVEVFALEPDELIGGKVYPDVVNEPDLAFTISDNSRNTVSVRTGLDLTNGGAISAGEVFQLRYAQEFSGGSDSAAVSDSDYLGAFDPNLSTLNKIFGKNKGFVKLATPGLVSTVVTKAGIEYAAARNYAFRVEFPSSILTEAAAITYVNSTIGRSDYAVCHFPSFGYIADPDAEQTAEDVPTKLVALIGQVLGREALVARQYDGFHKAPAGIDVTLPDVLELTTGDPETATQINEELTNPQGINLVKFRQGTAIVWGDRTLSPTSAWKWHQQRAQMSHYENVLAENFDWIVFDVNDADAREKTGVALRAYFYPEWTKGALRGDTFAEAFSLKNDEEINTDASMAAGDLNSEIKLKLAYTIERFKILTGKAGIFDAVE